MDFWEIGYCMIFLVKFIEWWLKVVKKFVNVRYYLKNVMYKYFIFCKWVFKNCEKLYCELSGVF